MTRLLLTLICTSFAVQSPAKDAYPYAPDTWVGIDAIGRPIADTDDATAPDSIAHNTTVGMFYYLWHGFHDEYREKDIVEILADNPDQPSWGKLHQFHWGSTPWFGRYRGGDPYIVAKHMKMLADSGIDFFFFDVTNAFIYPDAVRAMMAEADRREALGLKSPKFAFSTNSHGAATMLSIYRQFYKDHPDNSKYWFEYDGKPLILGDRAALEAEIAEDRKNRRDTTDKEAMLQAFTFRRSWAWLEGKNPDEWAWLEHHPQKPGWHLDGNDTIIEQISVSVAQHPYSKIGKSYRNGSQPPVDRYGRCPETLLGYYFNEQWSEAIRRRPPVVMVTQFNEWIAQRFQITGPDEMGYVRPGADPEIGETYFVDVYTPEFSRDIEPSRDPQVKDNYYLQLISNIRRYRGAHPIPTATVDLHIDINGPFDQWTAEPVRYLDEPGDAIYTSTEAQRPETLLRPTNDIIEAKVTRDGTNLYFLVSTADTISPPDIVWMRLLLNTDADYTTGWAGYDYMIAINPTDGLYTLMRHIPGKDFDWQATAPVSYRLDGNKLHLAIPYSDISYTGGSIDFKWTDNFAGGDPMYLISEGDTAPESRLNFRYKPPLND